MYFNLGWKWDLVFIVALILLYVVGFVVMHLTVFGVLCLFGAERL